jgi:hypothetical protein
MATRERCGWRPASKAKQETRYMSNAGTGNVATEVADYDAITKNVFAP